MHKVTANKITSEFKSNRFTLVVFTSIVVLGFLSFLSFCFIDDKTIVWLYTHNDMSVFAGSRLIKVLGKVYTPLWLIFLWGYITKRPHLVLAGSLSLLLSLAVVGPCKIFAHRERPCKRLEHTQIVRDSDGNITALKDSLSGPAYGRFGMRNLFRSTRYQSFPSGDTVAMFAPVVVAASFVSGFSSSVLFILAGVVAFLRVAGLFHYPSDVLAAAAIGIFCGWLALRISRQWISQNSFNINEWWQKAVIIGIFLIPILSFFSDGIERFLVFLAGSAALAGCIYLTEKISMLRRKNSV